MANGYPIHISPQACFQRRRSGGTMGLSNLWKSFTDPETRVFQAADGEDVVIYG